MTQQEIKDKIDNYIKQNGKQEITAVLVNEVLQDMMGHIGKSNGFNSNEGEVEIGIYTKPDNSTTPIYQLCFESVAADMQLNTPWANYASINVSELNNIGVLSAELWLSDGTYDYSGYASLFGDGKAIFFWTGGQLAVRGKITYIKL